MLENYKSSEDMCKPFNESETFHKDILKCDKNSQPHGPNSHICKLSSCYTNGYCFKWLHKDGGMLTTTYGCLAKEMIQPFGQPLLCHGSKARAHDYKVACCYSGDGCNSNISLKLESPPSSSMTNFFSSSNESPNMAVLTVLILLPIIVLSLCIVTSYCFWRRYQCFGLMNKSTASTNGSYSLGRPATASTSVDVTIPLIDGESQNSTIKELIEEETCSGLINFLVKYLKMFLNSILFY